MCLHLTKGIVFAAALAVPSIIQIVRQLIAANWPCTDGIVDGHVVRRRLGPNDSTNYEASPTYSYSVAGAKFRGDRLSIADTSENVTYAYAQEKIIKRFPIGSSVKVYFNPHRPQEAVLELQMRIVVPVIVLLAALAFASSGQPFNC